MIKVSLQRLGLIIFGIIVSATVLELALRMGGLALVCLQNYQNYVAIRNCGEFRIMCLGESTTYSGGKYSYPYQLQEILSRKEGRVSVINSGVPAITSEGVLAQLEGNILKYKPHMVVCMLGINDLAQLGKAGGAIIHVSPVKEFFRSLKTYKFVHLLELRIKQKIAELKLRSFAQNIISQAIAQEAQSGQTGADIEQIIKKGYEHIKQGDLADAENYFKKALTIDPKNSEAYVGLAWTYRHMAKAFNKRIKLFKTAIAADRRNIAAYEGLANEYLLVEDYDAAYQVFLKILKLKPDVISPYLSLAWYHGMQGDLIESEKQLKLGEKVNPRSDRLYGQMSLVYLQMGNDKEWEKYHGKATQMAIEGIKGLPLYGNYRKIKEILDKNKIQMVCVQYPVRSIKSLQFIFEGYDNLIFVDNENIFKEALRKNNYGVYFDDLFGGDFGHCTREGNRLIAKNIADTIIKEYFCKRGFGMNGLCNASPGVAQ